MTKKHRCSTCGERFWTFGGKMSHVAALHPRGVPTCAPDEHELVDALDNETVCLKCGSAFRSEKT